MGLLWRKTADVLLRSGVVLGSAVSDQRGTLVGMERRNDKLALKNPGSEKCFKKGGLRHSNLRHSRILAQPKSLYFSNDKGG